MAHDASVTVTYPCACPQQLARSVLASSNPSHHLHASVTEDCAEVQGVQCCEAAVAALTASLSNASGATDSRKKVKNNIFPILVSMRNVPCHDARQTCLQFETLISQWELHAEALTQGQGCPTSSNSSRRFSIQPEDTVYGGPTAPLPKRVTLRTLQNKYRKNQPISMVTAYDYPSAVHVSNHTDQTTACTAALHEFAFLKAYFYSTYMLLSPCMDLWTQSSVCPSLFSCLCHTI